MPQINRIRVNNVKYNFGTQFYDDFMMSFSCKNTIYDLANGGGKSVLMLLLLQNLIPNCTLDDKQPVEKLFRTQGGSNVIHSLVEWKLDSCYQTDGYRYMTTGFCARKAKDSGEENSKETAGMEYFNYCIFYKEFGDNDIKNLPLSSNGERITYNGLKSYLRSLDKNDLSVSVRIFERKGDYQNFIAGYGLFESHWEIVRGINKTEGHVRTYFETNYKTARKVIEDLLIEEIIQKSYHSRIGISGAQDDMASTLLDIKDKLAELARKKEQISDYDKQIAAMEAFGGKILSFRDMMEEKRTLKLQLSEYLLKCRRLIADTQKELEMLSAKKEHQESMLSEEKRLIAVAKVMDEYKNLEEMNTAARECADALEKLYADERVAKNNLSRTEAAGEYRDYLEYKTLRKEVLITIENGMRDRQEISGELYALAAKKFIINKQAFEELTNRKEDADNEYIRTRSVLEQSQENKRNQEILLAVSENNVSTCEKRLEAEEKTLAQLLADCEILVSQELAENIAFQKETRETALLKLENDRQKLSDSRVAQETLKTQLLEKSVEVKQLGNRETQLKEKENREKDIAERLMVLSGVYKETEPEKLVRAVYQIYKNQLKAVADSELNLRQTEEYIHNLKEGRLVFDGRQYKMVEKYLKDTYGDDVMYGRDWFAGLDAGMQRDIIKRVPFVEYAFVIKDDFERIKEDASLRSFQNCSYVVPVISENIIYSTRLGVDLDNIAFGMQDFNFLKEEGRLMDAISRAEEELEDIQATRDKIADRLKIIEDDYAYVSEQAVKNDATLKELQTEYIEIDKNKIKLEEEIRTLKEQLALADAKIARLLSDITSGERICQELTIRENLLIKAADKKAETDLLIEELEELKLKVVKCRKEQAESGTEAEEARAAFLQAELNKKHVDALFEERTAFWQKNYATYFKEDVAPFDAELSEEELDARFMGLKSVVESSSVDLQDKEVLAKTYETSMNKSLKAIEYRGFSVDDIRKDYEAGKLFAADTQHMLQMKNDLKELETRANRLADEYNSRTAQINRVEGSISHALGLLEETYGGYEPFECSDIPKYIAEHEAGLRRFTDEIKKLDKECKTVADGLNGYRMMERDILRITKNAGIDMPQERVYEMEVSVEELADYEQTEKRLQTLIKKEASKREDFLSERQKLTELLKSLGAEDLAAEASRSIRVPETTEDVSQMLEGIREINQCIGLERDSVTAGIEDMEKIKDSFENRCIQTCVNIRSELDRLGQLSKITMDDEVISIIGLVIPYIKEEFYKERMSSYINDTVAFAENFKAYDEKIKYIRTRLSWKKLFSVIVTDMNQVKINLYKRERIKSQSRYLRYEEAVGSTGQSQGIYIQFLIAIINYIASINAAGKEVAVMGKTIFIDNPFGAAKDVYIWEPIFKMLKTNHVQLVVPARGVTPAITGRFDVNYILGQKLVGDMQQTVVVEYESQVKSEELEYTRLEYEQQSLF